MTSTLSSNDELQRLCKFIYENNLPKEVVLYMNVIEYNKTNDWLKDMAYSGNYGSEIPKSGIKYKSLIYNGITFNIVCYQLNKQ